MTVRMAHFCPECGEQCTCLRDALTCDQGCSHCLVVPADAGPRETT